jgi:hypothetical protein
VLCHKPGAPRKQLAIGGIAADRLPRSHSERLPHGATEQEAGQAIETLYGVMMGWIEERLKG